MATTRRDIQAGVDAVWAVLADGHSFGNWVVGAQKIRAVDVGFPAVGARLHYRMGFGPLHSDGDTEVTAVDPGTRLQLEAKAWPAGTALITLTLTGSSTACQVTLEEKPHRGLAKTLHNPLTDIVVDLRNREQLRRLERLALLRPTG